MHRSKKVRMTKQKSCETIPWMQPHNQMKPPSPHDRGQTSGFPRSQSQESCSFGAAPPLGSGIKSVATLPTTNTRADPGHTHTHAHARAEERLKTHHSPTLSPFISPLSLSGINFGFAKTWFPRNAAAPSRTGEIFIFTSLLWAFFNETWAWKSCAGQECLLSFDLLRCMNLRNWWLKWARITAGVQRFAATHT